MDDGGEASGMGLKFSSFGIARRSFGRVSSLLLTAAVGRGARVFVAIVVILKGLALVLGVNGSARWGWG